MNPLNLFFSLLAVAGGLFCCGLSLIALSLLWAAIRGWAERDR